VSLHIAACGEKNDKLRHVDTVLYHTAASLPHLNNMKLEHPVTASEQFDISMLIGADKYCDVIQDDIIRGDGPTAVKTGYPLTGKGKRSFLQNIIGCVEAILDTTVKLANHACSLSTPAFKILAGVLYKCIDRL